MFGDDAIRTNFINEVTWWSHYDNSREDRANFTARRNKDLQDLFGEDDLTVETVFVDPIDALPRKKREQKMELYNDSEGALETQEQELEELRTFIWDRASFSCKDTCSYAEGWSLTEVIFSSVFAQTFPRFFLML